MIEKKGFTLIEIIICIILLGIIGTTTTVLTIKYNKKTEEKKISELNKKILEAAAVFTEIEKDETGNSYSKTILDGAKGVKIPLSYLVDKGYISEQNKTDVYSLNKLDETKKYYVMALNGLVESDASNNYCDNTGIEFTPSWTINSDKPIYLCNDYKKYAQVVQVINNVQEVNNNTRLKVSLDKMAVSEEFYNTLSEEEKSKYTLSENGIFTLYDENVNTVYTYYRGAIKNNYLKLGKSLDGNDLLWRILWMNGNNKMKIILDQEIPITLKNQRDEVIIINKNDSIYNFYNDDYNLFILNPNLDSNPEDKSTSSNGKETVTIVTYNRDSLLKGVNNYYDMPMYSDKNYYFNQMKSWYETTNLEEYEFITNSKNFCSNNYYKDSSDSGRTDYSYEPTNRFACKYGSYGNRSSAESYIKSSLFYSSPVGYLTYGDAVRAGLIVCDTTRKGDNFLLSKQNNSYPIVDLYREYYYNNRSGGINSDIEIYFVENVIKYDTIHFKKREDSDTNYYTKYKVVSPDGVELFERYNYTKSGMILNETKFVANSIKPSLILDLTNYKISDSNGTIEEPFEIIPKNN